MSVFFDLVNDGKPKSYFPGTKNTEFHRRSTVEGVVLWRERVRKQPSSLLCPRKAIWWDKEAGDKKHRGLTTVTTAASLWRSLPRSILSLVQSRDNFLGLQTVRIINSETRVGLRQPQRRGNWLLPGEQNKHHEEVTTSLTQQEQKCEPPVFLYLFSYTSCVYFSLFTNNIFLS